MPMECRDVPARSPDVPGIFTQRYLPCILKHKSYYMKMDFQNTMKLVMVCSGVAKTSLCQIMNYGEYTYFNLINQ